MILLVSAHTSFWVRGARNEQLKLHGAGMPTAELVIDFSLEKEVRVVTSDNKMVKHKKGLVG